MSKSKAGEALGCGFILLYFGLIAAFWVAVLYIAWHFIVKYW